MARRAQSAKRKALNLVVLGSSPTVGDSTQLRAESKATASCTHRLETWARTHTRTHTHTHTYAHTGAEDLQSLRDRTEQRGQ